MYKCTPHTYIHTYIHTSVSVNSTDVHMNKKRSVYVFAFMFVYKQDKDTRKCTYIHIYIHNPRLVNITDVRMNKNEVCMCSHIYVRV